MNINRLEDFMLIPGLIFLSGIAMMFIEDYSRIIPLNIFYYYFMFWLGCGILTAIISFTVKILNKQQKLETEKQ